MVASVLESEFERNWICFTQFVIVLKLGNVNEW